MSAVSRSEAVVVGLIAFVILLLVAYCQGERHTRADDATQHAFQSVKAADSVRVVVHDTVTVRERQKARIDTLVQVASETTVVIRTTPSAPPETVHVAPQLVSRFVIDDSLIAGLHVELGAANRQIATRDSLLRLPKPREHWGIGLGAGYGCGRSECGPTLTLGVVWKW